MHHSIGLICPIGMPSTCSPRITSSAICAYGPSSMCFLYLPVHEEGGVNHELHECARIPRNTCSAAAVRAHGVRRTASALAVRRPPCARPDFRRGAGIPPSCRHGLRRSIGPLPRADSEGRWAGIALLLVR